MKFLQNYDEALDTTVLSILEQNFAEGVRSTEQTQASDHEPITTLPSDTSIFPKLSQAGSINKDSNLPPSKMQSLVFKNNIMSHEISSTDWSAAGLSESVDKYVIKINHYAKRMESVVPRGDSHAYHAANAAAEMSDAIFSRITSLREPKMTKQVKQRALVDLFKCLKKQGYSSMKWSVPPNIRAAHDMLQLPVPSLENATSLDVDAPVVLEKGESYFHRTQVEITRLSFEISMFGSQYMSQREMTLMQGYSEYVLFMMCQQRCMIANMIQSVSDIESSIQSYEAVVDSLPMGQMKLSANIKTFEISLLSLVEGLRQVVLLLKESLPLVENDTDRGHVHDTVAILTSCASTLEESYRLSHGELPITAQRVQKINTEMVSILEDTKSNLSSCVKVCASTFPTHIFDSCMADVNQALSLAHTYKEKAEDSHLASSNSPRVQATIQQISTLVQDTLLSVQSVTTGKEDKEDEVSLSQNHKDMLQEWDNLRLGKINSQFSELSNALVHLHDDQTANDHSRSLCTKATVNSLLLLRHTLELAKARLGDALLFYQEHSKFLYILLRVFRVLISKGFCADDVSDGGEGDGEGGAGEMKFEDDIEGTGMGEGDGKEDVTDQIENEEQLLGLKGDENQEAQSQDNKELKEDEVDTGMEMENDFDGEKFDMPDQPDDDKDDESDEDEEELDREMGDGEDPNEEVVDEKMWDNEEDDLNEMQQETEKFEDNSKMAGDQLEDEMRTGEGEDDDEGAAKEDGPQDQGSNENELPQEEGPENEDEEMKINDDLEENYEDKNGVEVRNEDQNASGGEEEDEEGVNLEELNLDEGDEDPTGDADGADGNENIDENADPDPEEAGSDAEENVNVNEDAPPEEDQEMEEPDAMEKVGDGGVGVEDNDDDQPDENQDIDTSLAAPPKSHYESNDALGVAADDGQDAVKEMNEDSPDQDENANEGAAAEENSGADDKPSESKGAGGSGSDGNWQKGKDEEQNSESQNESFDDVPNPFRNPGDAEKFWHKKLDMIQDSQEDQDQPSDHNGQEPQEEENKEKDGQFEYTKEGESNSGQVLGVAEEDQAKQLEDHSNDDFDQTKQEMEDKDMDIEGADNKPEKRNQSNTSQTNANKESLDQKANHDSDEEEDQQMNADDETKEEEEDAVEDEAGEEETLITNRATTDRRQLQDHDSDNDGGYESDGDIQEMDFSEGLTLEDIQAARSYWQTIQSDTNNLSRRLCEKLRLVMEPLVATKLRGDYRTGKRVNMKRIIGYIASGYRKDKIWLRRTKPAKRDYRVLIAVDDSESMQKSQAGDMALKALATLANGMSQLEIGQLGIASFGEDMKLLHPFSTPFTSESGVNVVSNFKFDAKRTRTALCVESAIASLEGAGGTSSSMQLVFMISDGRIERDSRSKLRRLIRQMAEKNMLMVMIIVEGEEQGSAKKGKDSILNMKEVSFIKGKPKIKQFIEDYPFPYYLVVGDLAALPEILGDALRQWFEMLAQIQNAA